VAVNGVCLTVINLDKKGFTVEAVGETLTKTTIGTLVTGDAVNLERALRLSDRLGGHFVQGHVNGIGEVTRKDRRGNNWYLEIRIPHELERYVINEGSIAVNGISLTIAHLAGNLVGISVIPHTYNNTILNEVVIGSKVNIETDFLARYVENFILPKKETMSPEWLKKMGF
jgi:riboflavin synthase